jgi:hypothetical protein
MNLLDATQAPFAAKVFFFGLVAALAITLTVYTIVKASRLAEFLDALADERLRWRRKLRAFFEVWAKR